MMLGEIDKFMLRKGEWFSCRARSGLVIGYGAIAASRIDEGMKRLAASFGVKRVVASS